MFRQRRQGEFLYFQDDPVTAIWFVKKGTVVLARAMSGPDGAESPRAVRQAGDLLGLEALVGSHYLDSARAVTDLTVCAIPRDQVDNWIGPPETPARVALEQMLRAECGDVPRAAGADGSTPRRLARWILSEAEEGLAPALPRTVVAGMLGMVPETLSRALASLSKKGAIEITRKSLRVRDSAALAAIAGI